MTTAIGCQIGPDTHGMRIVKVTEKKIEHEFVPLVDFPENVEIKDDQKSKRDEEKA